MLHMAVVEDSPRDLALVKEYVAEYFRERSRRHTWDYRVSYYTDGRSFLKDFQPGKFQCLLLDIYMPYLTGMEVAKKVRAVDPDVKILFLTTSRDHALESYAVFASGYVLKPLSEHGDMLTQALDRALPEEAARAVALPVRVAGQQVLKIPLLRILYVDTGASRNATVHLCDRDIASMQPYQELADVLLAEGRFLECYHRLLLNMDYVKTMEDEDFLMKTGIRLPISRRKRKDVQQAYMQYLLEK